MRQVSDEFLLSVAEVSAGLVGLFLVGLVVYLETGARRSGAPRQAMTRYVRASTGIVLILFAIPIGLSLTLVALEPGWSRALFAVLSLLLLAANVQTVVRLRAVARPTASPLLLVTEAVGTAAVLALVVVPWALGGLQPSREHLTWAVLLAFFTGFLSMCAMVLLAFDLARDEAADRAGSERPESPRSPTPGAVRPGRPRLSGVPRPPPPPPS